MAVQYRCAKGERWLQVQKHPSLTGIDYLEVSEDQHTLFVYFIPKNTGDTIPPGLKEDNIRITRGTADSGIWVDGPLKEDGNCLTIPVADSQQNEKRVGDFSVYTLNLVGVPDIIDPLFSRIDFSFRITCPQTLDCKPDEVCILPSVPSPRIDYLSRDYGSFRQLMLDRLSLLLPTWKERAPADAMVALVEVLAYAADHLSYYQDAVATEAYLGTARKRVSVRRHARLLDYHMHDGCNARTWVQVWWSGCNGVNLSGPSKPGDTHVHGGTRLLTRAGSMPVLIPQDRLQEALAEGPVVFETMHDITLYEGNREILFYTWGETDCCLPRGATRATLAIPEDVNGAPPVLEVGDVLIFEEVCDPETKGPADPSHRHAVRLKSVSNTSEQDDLPLTDPLTGTSIIEIEWEEEDALPFPLCISLPDMPNISVARGNIVLADHGMTIPSDRTPYEVVPLENLGEVAQDGVFAPMLRYGPLTQQGFIRGNAGSREEMVAFDEHGPARAAFRWEMRDVLPAVILYDRNTGMSWRPVRDLLASDKFSREFVVETEEGGSPRIRFGDDVTGMYPAIGHSFDVLYRVGNGPAGNIGHDAIAHIVLPGSAVSTGSDIIRNPLPASGGTDPESMEKVRLDAPQAFRTQERAVTTDDYAMIAERHPDIQKAVASRRWTGSWYTTFVAVDRKGGKQADDEFRDKILAFLETYRLAGHDLEVVAPVFVPLDIELQVCVLPEYLAADVKEQLMAIFSCHTLPDGAKGFFHPDNFTFGQSVYLSAIVAAAMEVPGIRWVQVPILKRWEEPVTEQKEMIEIQPHEIARLDNDPSNIQNGRMVFTMRGGI